MKAVSREILGMIGSSSYEFEVDSTDSPEMICTFPKVLNFNWLILKLNRLYWN